MSTRDGGSHSGVKDETRTAMKRLKRRGDIGSPGVVVTIGVVGGSLPGRHIGWTL